MINYRNLYNWYLLHCFGSYVLRSKSSNMFPAYWLWNFNWCIDIKAKFFTCMCLKQNSRPINCILIVRLINYWIIKFLKLQFVSLGYCSRIPKVRKIIQFCYILYTYIVKFSAWTIFFLKCLVISSKHRNYQKHFRSKLTEF